MELIFLEKNNFWECIFWGSNFENVFWMLEQPVNNKGCSSIQFLVGEFYQEYKKVLLSFLVFLTFFGGGGTKKCKKFFLLFLGQESFISWNVRNFWGEELFLFFWTWGSKSASGSPFIYYFYILGQLLIKP